MATTKTTRPALDKSLTAALRRTKAARGRILCEDHNGAIYVSDGYFAALLTLDEYNALVRPVTQRDPGTWAIDYRDPTHDAPLCISKIFAGAVKACTGKPALRPAPLHTADDRGHALALYTSGDVAASDGFLIAFNPDLLSAVLPVCATLAASAAIAPAVVYDGNENPRAIVLPVRMKNDKIYNATRAAVLAYRAAAIGKAPDAAAAEVNATAAERLTHARKEAKEWRETAEGLGRERDDLERQLAAAQKRGDDLNAQRDALQADLAAAQKQIDALKQQAARASINAADANARAATAEASANMETPAARHAAGYNAAALAARLAALDGIQTAVHGAQTAAPVLWITGNTAAHKTALQAAGAKYSTKKAAYYIRVA